MERSRSGSQPPNSNPQQQGINFNNQNENFFSNDSQPSQYGYVDPMQTQPFSQQSLSPNSFQQQSLSPEFNPQMSGDGSFALDPSLQTSGGDQSINPADLMGNSISPTSGLPQQQSPQSQNQYFPNHSRGGSLDPSSAAMPQHGRQSGEWTNMMNGPAFQQHRRAPSEHSDISSVTHSPFPTQETFDQNHSPLLNAQADSQVYPDSLGIERFTISDAQQTQQGPQGQQVSPHHSPYPSPRMSPAQGNIQESQYVLGSNDNGQLGAGMYESQDTQGSQMAPPEINVEYVPSQKQNLFPPESAGDGLSPPERGRPNRMRAKSDPSFPQISRPLGPADTSPNLISNDPNQRHRSLSPFDMSYSGSRDPSPAGARSSRRSSTSSIPNREYILDLADPTRPTATGDGRQPRVQKHPATFQCHLCPKRFTRAYNLRSHLRTHTDERPFVCTVCGKAFARQHDRKRHEGLHSGEKKFVCKGDLSQGGTWGCGRRFARADALGRHFRSEAGRVCIKPLLDEEAAENQRKFELQMAAQHQAQQQNQAAAAAGGLLQPQPQPLSVNGGAGGAGGFTLPAALLAQYPALQGLQWDQLGSSGPGDDDVGAGGGGRASYDASSGGEMYDDEDPNSGYVSGPGTAYGNAWSGGQAAAAGRAGDWTSDYEGQ